METDPRTPHLPASTPRDRPGHKRRVKRRLQRALAEEARSRGQPAPPGDDEAYAQPLSDQDLPLGAERTDHLKTAPGSERVVAAPRSEHADEEPYSPPTERFRRDTEIEPVAIGQLPNP